MNIGTGSALKALYPENKDLRARLFDNSDKDSIHTPFSVLNAERPFSIQHLIKSHEFFYRLADDLVENHSSVIADRELSVVYPGSGAHLSPLLTATHLIDLGKIDGARFVYTELNPNTARDVYQALQIVDEWIPEYFENVELQDQTVSFTHAGKPVAITVQINVDTEIGLEAGESFSRQISQYMPSQYFTSADVIVLHDLYVDPAGASSALADYQRELNDGRVRIVVTPDMPRIYDTAVSRVPGPYGCSGDSEIGKPTNRKGAYIFELPK